MDNPRLNTPGRFNITLNPTANLSVEPGQSHYLPPYSPELNLIEILCKHAKYHWRRFVTWTKETIEAEIGKLLDGFGSEFQIRFS